MNKLFIIGNLTRDPELRTTASGVQVCSFTVAVNKRAQNEQKEAEFFRVTAWRQLADICSRYLAKGRKVAICGTVSVSTYTGNDGQTRATLEVNADDIEFLTPKQEDGSAFDVMKEKNYVAQERTAIQQEPAYVVVDEELPF